MRKTKTKAGFAAIAALFWLAPALAAEAPAPGGNPEGARIYDEHCAQCHSKGGPAKAPYKIFLHFYAPEAIVQALESGVMADQGAPLLDAGRRAVAEHLTGRKPSAILTAAEPPRCRGQAAAMDLTGPAQAEGWGFNLANTRFQPAARAGLEASELANLELAWAFAFPFTSSVRSQPTIAGNTLFVGDQTGRVYALDRETGCLRWVYKAQAEVRSAVALGQGPKGLATVFFGDLAADVYALDAVTGKLVWRATASTEQKATLTGSPAYHQGRLYVPVSSHEGLAAVEMDYPCCTFRGSVAAFDAATGDKVWSTLTIREEQKVIGHNSAGTEKWGPSGAMIWNRPTLDIKRNRLYVGTGENYSSPATDTSDSIMAMDLDTGKILWVTQALAGDAWNLACRAGPPENCPVEGGPDLDFGAATILATAPDGREFILAGQKSGAIFGLDPDHDGKILWRTQLGRGGTGGGVHWGMAAAEGRLFVAISDKEPSGHNGSPPRPGLFALDMTSGTIIWEAPAADICGGRPGCFQGLSAAVTAIPGAVLVGSLDGRLRAHDMADGHVLWQVDTAREFTTTSGATARGGSIDAIGPVVAGGMVYMGSGYALWSQMPGNALLAFRPARD